MSNSTLSINSDLKVDLNDGTANPAPLGLLGFGLTTVLLNLHNIGLFSFGSMILCMGIFYGGIAQIIAGIMEWKKNNTFGTTAFISYGFFWLTLAGLKLMPVLGLTEAPTKIEMGAFLTMWGIFSGVMFIGTLRINRNLQVVFGSLTALFFLLAIGDFTKSAEIIQVAGFVGVFCGSSAIYTGLSQVIVELYSKKVVVEDSVKNEQTKQLTY